MSNTERLSRDIKDAEKAVAQAEKVIAVQQKIIIEAQSNGQAIREELAKQTQIAQERLEGLQARMEKAAGMIQQANSVMLENRGILRYTRKAFEDASEDGITEAVDVAASE